MMYNTNYLNGNLRIATNTATDYYAFEKPTNGHKAWLPIFTATSWEALEERAKQHYQRMLNKNPDKYYTLMATILMNKPKKTA